MKKILVILFVFIGIGLKAQFDYTVDTLDLYRGGQIYYINISGDTLFINSDTIAGVTTDNLQAIYDTLGIHLDTLKAHNTRINTNLSNIGTNTSNISTNTTDIGVIEDTNVVQRTDINTNQSNIATNVINIGTNTTGIATINDTLPIHRIDINALNPVTGFNTINISDFQVTYLDGTVQHFSIAHSHPELLPRLVSVFQLTPISASPSTPYEGMIYSNSTDNHLYFYNGTIWIQLDN